ncbi:ATP-binding protein [Chthonobacter rhizosphaerae]|uniref:ATP-binding protein n=1 Tax=Chthonobacter rhizosphaerae TaxID=2735553 RepID=UPI0015EE94E3|nr:ATP-binding protein [Chthonobacter rhizosphaerae]
MSLRARLIGAITLVLVGVLLAGGVLLHWHAQRKVAIETAAALDVARNTVERWVLSSDGVGVGRDVLPEAVALFDGDRHVRLVLFDEAGREIARSRIPPPANEVPDWFIDLIAPTVETVRIDVPGGAGVRTLALEPDPRSEMDEVWGDVVLILSVVATFFLAAFGFIVAIIGRALAPIAALTDAMRRIGAGDYAIRIPEAGSPELASLCRGCNDMAARLGDMADRNRQLTDQIERLQDEERAELARDLHDEVGPFLFAVDVDAAAIEALVAETGGGPRGAEIADRAEAVRAAAGHARTHVRGILGQLRPGLLGSLGLAAAIRDMVAAQEDRHPAVDFDLDVTDAAFGVETEAAILAVVREAVTNALKHAAPARIEISVTDLGGEVAIRVADDGCGLKDAGGGYGLIGMRERVESLGGDFTIGDRPGGRGVAVSAIIPVRAVDNRRVEPPLGRAAE